MILKIKLKPEQFMRLLEFVHGQRNNVTVGEMVGCVTGFQKFDQPSCHTQRNQEMWEEEVVKILKVKPTDNSDYDVELEIQEITICYIREATKNRSRSVPPAFLARMLTFVIKG